MAHALNRVSMAAADAELPLFGFVAKNPGVNAKYCHVFHMRTKRHAEHLQGLVMKAFRLAYSNRRQSIAEEKGPKGAAAAAAAAKQKAQNQNRPNGGGNGAAAARAGPERVADRRWAKHNPLPHGPGADVAAAALGGRGSKDNSRLSSREPSPKVSPKVPRKNPPSAPAAAAAPRKAPQPSAPPAAAPKAPAARPMPAVAAAPAPVIISAHDYADTAELEREENDFNALEAHAWFQAGGFISCFVLSTHFGILGAFVTVATVEAFIIHRNNLPWSSSDLV